MCRAALCSAIITRWCAVMYIDRVWCCTICCMLYVCSALRGVVSSLLSSDGVRVTEAA